MTNAPTGAALLRVIGVLSRVLNRLSDGHAGQTLRERRRLPNLHETLPNPPQFFATGGEGSQLLRRDALAVVRDRVVARCRYRHVGRHTQREYQFLCAALCGHKA